MKKIFLIFSVLILIGAAALRPVSGQVATGGIYTLEQSVTASGGATVINNGNYTVGSTIGQTIAGQKATGQNLSVHAGFWNPASLAPTAASVTVSGRVTTVSGAGIRNVSIQMTGANGEIRFARTGTFGFFRFDDVTVGEAYTFSAAAKRYQFLEPIQIRSIFDSVDDLNFVGFENTENKGPFRY